MFVKMDKRAQSTLEYALLIAVVVAVLIAMQTYMKRGLQGKMKDSTDSIGSQFSVGASTYDYTTKTSTESHENTLPGNEGAKGGITTSDSNQTMTRTGTEYVGKSDQEYWPQ